MDHDEYAAELKKQQDAYQMVIDQRRMEVKNFIADLSNDDLMTFAKILNDCNEPRNLTMLQGVVQGNMMYQRGMSWTGTSVQEEVEEFFKTQDKPVAPPRFEAYKPVDQEKPLTADERLELDHINAKNWGLEWNSDPKYPDEYRCKSCLTPVHSLEDRMLRPPGVEGCPTCQQRAKWGGSTGELK